MYCLEKLALKLEYYQIGIHPADLYVKPLVAKISAQIKKIEVIKDAEEKVCLSKKLINACQCYVIYFESTQSSIDLRNVLLNFLEKNAPEDLPKLAHYEMLEHMLESYKRDTYTNVVTKAKVKKLLALTHEIKKKNDGREKEDKARELTVQCKKIEDGKKEKLAQILKVTRLATQNNVGRMTSHFEGNVCMQLHFQELGKAVQTVVYIWEPFGGLNGNILEPISGLHGTTGHVACKIGDIYFSFWPATNSKDKLTLGTLSKQNTYFEDIRDEGRPPDHRISLYGLNTEKMIRAGQILKGLKWQAYACGKKSCRETTARNCSSMVANILVYGGIRDHFPAEERMGIFPAVSSVEEIQSMLDRHEKDNQVKEQRVDYIQKGRKVVDVGGAVGYIGVSYWNFFTKKSILPNNFLAPVSQASEIERVKYGVQLAEFRKNRHEQKQIIHQKITGITGVNYKEKFSDAKKGLIEQIRGMHTLTARLLYSEEVYEQQKIFQGVLVDAKHRYRELVSQCLREEISEEVIKEKASFIFHETKILEKYELTKGTKTYEKWMNGNEKN